MVVAEIFLSAFITVLFEKLASGTLLMKYARLQKLDVLLEKSRRRLSLIRAALDEAESRQYSSDDVKQWLIDLQVLAYDLDDAVDELTTEALQRDLRESQAHDHAAQNQITSKVRRLIIPTCCTTFSSAAGGLKFQHGMVSKIDKISGRLQDLVEQMRILKLSDNVLGTRTPSLVQQQQMITTSLVVESHVFGREKDKQELLNLLKGGQEDDQLAVIPIVGMGGLGKTTLVQLVYSDKSLDEIFGLKAWVCVSDVFDVPSITKTILMAVSDESCENYDLNKLHVKLKEILSRKRFLLVLDDVWNEKYDDWDLLRRPFLAGLPGSKIIVTTRNDRVAEIMSSSPTQAYYRLKELTSENCLSLLAQHALGTPDFDAHPNLEGTGKNIVNKCKKLPLAVKTLGGLLRRKLDPKEWEDILNSEIWDFRDEESNILPSLKLSYHHLPRELKRCFAYCAIFPKDYEFDEHELVLLWMAEGFLQQSNKGKLMEDTGRAYFKELLSRSFFQQSSANNSRFVMHDLINDLAQYVAGDICYRQDLEHAVDNGLRGGKLSTTTCHSSYILPNDYHYAVKKEFDIFLGAPRLRTFFSLTLADKNKWWWMTAVFVSQSVLDDVLMRTSPCLRVLSLGEYRSMCYLSESVSKLKHLRFLNLSGTSLKVLPESMTDLYNLQTLLLRDCKKLTGLPASMKNLINLRHLDNDGTPQLHEMPSGIGELTNLQTLPKIVVSKSKTGLKLKELGSLPLLRGNISITKLNNVTDCQDAKKADLVSKTNLEEVRFEWSSNFDDFRDESLELEVLSTLQPPANLIDLKIVCYGGREFPDWVNNFAFSKIVKLHFEGCRKCTSLPPLGHLCLLKELSIQGMHGVKIVGEEFFGGSKLSPDSLPFASLEKLLFEDMPEWEEWEALPATQFPRLRKLELSGCPKLRMVSPLQFPSLGELSVASCGNGVLKSLLNLSSLTSMELYDVKGLTSLDQMFVEFSLTLETLKVKDCQELVSLWSPSTMPDLVHLQSLKVKKCPKLKSIDEIGTLPKLASLQIYIDSMASPTPLWTMPKLPSTLTSLDMSGVGQLKEVPETFLENCSTSLQTLSIERWSDWNISFHNFINITRLDLDSCDGLETFPEGGLPTPKLTNLHLWNCKNLKRMPNRMEETLSSLQTLTMYNCPSLESFPHGNFPLKLVHLSVGYCEKLKPLPQWTGLHTLANLSYFWIEGGGFREVVSFTDDDEECLLPPTLTILSVSGLPNLETLSKGFQNLTSLRHLYITDCPKLIHLPNHIIEKLMNLEIDSCPLLGDRCLKDKGDYWPLIADIPRVVIDDKSIYEQS